MPRSLWNGTVAFGLVRVPVKLHSATDSKKIAFRERHVTDGAAIEHRRVCVKEGREVPFAEIVKGFEVASGSFVVLSKEEIAVADGSEARVIEIEHFVDVGDIDPVYYERAYYLSPGKLGEEPYLLLLAALKRSERAGIGRFVFHNKAHLVAIRALEDVIVLHTMRFADELVPEGEVEFDAAPKAPTKLEVDTAELLIAQLDSSFDPEDYSDTYRDALMALIERKARGEAIGAPDAEQATHGGDDLLATLQASLKASGGTGRRRSGRAGRVAAPSTKHKPARTRGEH